jgi:hypothetical protein
MPRNGLTEPECGGCDAILIGADWAGRGRAALTRHTHAPALLQQLASGPAGITPYGPGRWVDHRLNGAVSACLCGLVGVTALAGCTCTNHSRRLINTDVSLGGREGLVVRECERRADWGGSRAWHHARAAHLTTMAAWPRQPPLLAAAAALRLQAQRPEGRRRRGLRGMAPGGQAGLDEPTEALGVI